MTTATDLGPDVVDIPTAHGFNLYCYRQSYMAQALRANGDYEPADTALVKSLVTPGAVCIDAGAHVGYYSCLMAKLGASVIAFEPNPRIYPLLVANLDRVSPAVGNMWRAHCLALSDSSDESVTYHLPSEFDDGWGSLAAPDERALGQRLQDMRIFTSRIRLLKMDVEGNEVPALRGLGVAIELVDHVLVECIDIPRRMTVTGSTVVGIDNLLQAVGMRPREYAEGQWRPVAHAYSAAANFWYSRP